MKIRRLHRWDVTYAQAIAIQNRLRSRIIRSGPARPVRLIAGADVSYEKSDNRFYCAVAVMELPQLSVIEQVMASGVASFPYIPGMLTFREGPILVEAFEKLENRPDIVIFDGQGIAHPRGFGLAAHMGLILDIPSIGCAKTRLCGEHAPVPQGVSSCSKLRYDGKTIGMVVRTRKSVKPVFISIGHRVSLKRAVEWVLRSCRAFRLPEPTRRAHILVNQFRLNAKGGR